MPFLYSWQTLGTSYGLPSMTTYSSLKAFLSLWYCCHTVHLPSWAVNSKRVEPIFVLQTVLPQNVIPAGKEMEKKEMLASDKRPHVSPTVHHVSVMLQSCMLPQFHNRILSKPNATH